MPTLLLLWPLAHAIPGPTSERPTPDLFEQASWTEHAVGELRVELPGPVERRSSETSTLFGTINSETWVTKTPTVWFAVTRVELPGALRAMAPTSMVVQRAQREVLQDSLAELSQVRLHAERAGRRLWFEATKEPGLIDGMSDIYVEGGTLFTLTVVRNPAIDERLATRFLDSVRWP